MSFNNLSPPFKALPLEGSFFAMHKITMGGILYSTLPSCCLHSNDLLAASFEQSVFLCLLLPRSNNNLVWHLSYSFRYFRGSSAVSKRNHLACTLFKLPEDLPAQILPPPHSRLFQQGFY
jgi:hypothetical protein